MHASLSVMQCLAVFSRVQSQIVSLYTSAFSSRAARHSVSRRQQSQIMSPCDGAIEITVADSLSLSLFISRLEIQAPTSNRDCCACVCVCVCVCVCLCVWVYGPAGLPIESIHTKLRGSAARKLPKRIRESICSVKKLSSHGLLCLGLGGGLDRSTLCVLCIGGGGVRTVYSCVCISKCVLVAIDTSAFVFACVCEKFCHVRYHAHALSHMHKTHHPPHPHQHPPHHAAMDNQVHSHTLRNTCVHSYTLQNTSVIMLLIKVLTIEYTLTQKHTHKHLTKCWQ